MYFKFILISLKLLVYNFDFYKNLQAVFFI